MASWKVREQKNKKNIAFWYMKPLPLALKNYNVADNDLNV